MNGHPVDVGVFHFRLISIISFELISNLRPDTPEEDIVFVGCVNTVLINDVGARNQFRVVLRHRHWHVRNQTQPPLPLSQSRATLAVNQQFVSVLLWRIRGGVHPAITLFGCSSVGFGRKRTDGSSSCVSTLINRTFVQLVSASSKAWNCTDKKVGTVGLMGCLQE